MYERFSKQYPEILASREMTGREPTYDQRYFFELLKSQPLRKSCKICRQIFERKSYDYVVQGIPFIVCSYCTHHNSIFCDDNNFVDKFFQSSKVDYSKHYKKNYEERKKDVYDPKIQFLVDYCLYSSKKITGILDIGTGAGHLLGCLQNRNIDCVGYDPSIGMKDISSRYNRNAPYYTNLEEALYYAFEENSFNCVSCIFALEHVPDPGYILSRLRAYSPELIYVSVPLASGDLLTDPLFPHLNSAQLAGAHTNLFTSDSLDYLFRNYDYEPVAKWWFGRNGHRLINKIISSAEILTSYSDKALECLRDYLSVVSIEFQKVIDSSRLSDEVHAIYMRRT